MIFPANAIRVFLVIKPIDFRKGMDGLAAHVKNELNLDPFEGAIFIFRSKRADRMKIILWDGRGLVMVYKRIETTHFKWPKVTEGTIKLTKTQFEALFEGIDWRRVVEARQLRVGSG